MTLRVSMPADGLQGQAIPGHVLWDNEAVSSITVRRTPEFAALEAFNADPDSTTVADGVHVVSRFLRPGYLGFVMQTRRLDTLDATATVEITVQLETGPQSFTKPVRLFRPNLSILSIPAKITFDDKGMPDTRLVLGHEGHGTLFVTVKSTTDSAVQTVIPPELASAMKGFAEDMGSGLQQLASKYPHYPDLFSPLQANDFSDRERLGRRLLDVLETIGEDRKLAVDLSDLYTRATLQHSDFESLFFAPLIDFISSIVTSQTILTTPWQEFHIPAGKSQLQLEITAEDILRVPMLQETLPPIEVESACEQSVPIDRLLAWSDRTRSRLPHVAAKPSRALRPPRPSQARRAR
jgi:hypothetical protein